MAKMRERNEQIELLLERRHIVLLGFCALVLGALLFVLGMLTQRSLTASNPLLASVVTPRKEATPPHLFPNRSKQPNVQQGTDLKFYNSLTGEKGEGPNPAEKRRHVRQEALPQRAAVSAMGEDVPVNSAVATSTSESRPGREREVKPVAIKAQVGGEAAKSRAEAKSKSVKERPSPGFAVQVGAFADRGGAQAQIKKLQGKGYKASMEPVRVKGKLVYRVSVGNYDSKTKAQKAASRLAAVVGSKNVKVRPAAEG